MRQSQPGNLVFGRLSAKVRQLRFLGAIRYPIHRNTIRDTLRPANSDLEASFVDIRSFRGKSKSIDIEISTRFDPDYDFLSDAQEVLF
jgi:hypothetical protein